MAIALTPKKKWIKITLLGLAALFILDFSKNLITQTIVTTALSQAARVPVSVGNTEVNLLKGSIRLKNLRLSNPRGYPERWMAEVPEVFVDLDPGALWKGQIHAEEIRLFVSSFSVIKNKEGKLNIQAMKSAMEAHPAKPLPADRVGVSPSRTGTQPALKIDKLCLTLDKVFYKDYSHGGGTPEVQKFDLGIQNRIYRNINDPSEVLSLVVLEAMTRTTISRLTNMDLSFFKDRAQGVLSEGLAGIVKEGTGTISDTAKSLLNLFK